MDKIMTNMLKTVVKLSKLNPPNLTVFTVNQKL